jgi:hypothetical protein
MKEINIQTKILKSKKNYILPQFTIEKNRFHRNI